MLPRLSPAGDRLVVQVGATRDLWTYDFGRGTLTKLTSDRIIAYSAPAWTPDGSRVVFRTWFDGDVGLGWLHPDGSGPVEELVKGIGLRSFERTHPVMLPDGSGLIMTGLAPGAIGRGSPVGAVEQRETLGNLVSGCRCRAEPRDRSERSFHRLQLGRIRP